MKIADEKELDLVLVSDNVKPPICKLINYNKMLYIREKNKKTAKGPELKEVKMRCNIMEHDIKVKIKTAQRILKEKDKVKISIIFKGREMAYIKNGEAIVKKCVDELSDIATMTGSIKTEHNQVSVILAPK